MEERVGRHVGLQGFTLLESSAGQVGDGRSGALLLLDGLWFVLVVDFHLFLRALGHLVVILGRVDDLASVGVCLELVLPLILELAHALIVEFGTISLCGCCSLLAGRVAGRRRGALSHAGCLLFLRRAKRRLVSWEPGNGRCLDVLGKSL